MIDIQVTVRDLGNGAAEALARAGWRRVERVSADHVPAGEDADPSRWAKLLFREPAGRRRVNLHVRVAGMPNQRYPLLFRDYLRAHPDAARSLEQVKRELARRHPDDIDAYCAIKDPVCDLVMAAADAWARATGWQPDEAGRTD